MSASALKHIEHLANVIGPRGSGTPQEKAGHAYAQQTLAALRFATRVETFQAPTSAYTPFGLGLGAVLVAEGLFWFMGATPDARVGALAAGVLTMIVIIAAVLELLGRDNPLRWFTGTVPSQNVVGVAPAAGEARRRAVLMAHVDTHRTPFIWQSRSTFQLYRVLSTLAMASLVALEVIFVMSVSAPSETLRTVSLSLAAIVALMFGLVVQAHFTPYTAGANDNASGVGVMLALAEQLKLSPLLNTEVWWVATGGEEVGAYGSADFVRRHRFALNDATVIVVDNIAGQGTGPVYLRSEGILIPFAYPPQTLALADQLAQAQPELGARSVHQRGAYTDGMPALNTGLRALALVGYTREGWIPNWHNVSDIFANVDAEAVDRTERFVWALLNAIDGGR